MSISNNVKFPMNYFTKAFVLDCFTILIIIFMAVPPFLWTETSVATRDVIKGNITGEVIKAVIYLIVSGLLLAQWKSVVRLSTNNIIIWVFVFWVFASFCWSGEPSLTFRRAGSFLGVILVGLYIASYYDYGQFLRIAGRVFMITSLLSLIAIIFVPAQGIMLDPVGWRGIYGHKNSLGQMSLFGIATFLGLLSSKERNINWAIGLILSYILLVGSRSGTSLLMSVCVLFLWSILFAFRNRSKPFLTFLIVLLLNSFVFGIWLYLADSIQMALGMLGKDLTLTGRTIIWEEVLSTIRQRPWLGYGFGAVWIGEDYGVGSYIGKSINYFAVNAHNGFLDLVLETGIIGLTLFSFVLIIPLCKSLSIIRDSIRTDHYQIWPVLFLITLILYNFTESTLTIGNYMDWVFIAYFSFETAGKENALKHRVADAPPGQSCLSNDDEGKGVPQGLVFGRFQ